MGTLFIVTLLSIVGGGGIILVFVAAIVLYMVYVEVSGAIDLYRMKRKRLKEIKEYEDAGEEVPRYLLNAEDGSRTRPRQ